jgi:hypothetical protein
MSQLASQVDGFLSGYVPPPIVKLPPPQVHVAKCTPEKGKPAVTTQKRLVRLTQVLIGDRLLVRDGLVSNGHWMIRTECIHPASGVDSSSDSLIARYKLSSCLVGDDAHKSMAGMMKLNPSQFESVSMTPWVYDNGGLESRIFSLSDGRCVAVALTYADKFLSDVDVFVSEDGYMLADDPENPTRIVMSCLTGSNGYDPLWSWPGVPT